VARDRASAISSAGCGGGDVMSLRPRAIQRQYAGDENRPLGGYVGAMTVYGSLVAGLSGLTRARGTELPTRPSWSDIALISIATHKVSRLIAKDPITSPIRAPFTRFVGQSGEAELSEEVIGTGAQHAIGELLTCPFCLAQWVATAFVFGLVLAPRATRLSATVFTAVAASDLLQYGYDATQQKATG
jgi:hypothetical protein